MIIIIFSQTHLISHPCSHLQYDIVDSWPWLERHNNVSSAVYEHLHTEVCAVTKSNSYNSDVPKRSQQHDARRLHWGGGRGR
jgi:hypothetical protein